MDISSLQAQIHPQAAAIRPVPTANARPADGTNGALAAFDAAAHKAGGSTASSLSRFLSAIGDGDGDGDDGAGPGGAPAAPQAAPSDIDPMALVQSLLHDLGGNTGTDAASRANALYASTRNVLRTLGG